MPPESAAGWSGPGEDGSPSSCESWCSPASQRLLPEGWVEGVLSERVGSRTLSPWNLIVPQTAVRDPLAAVTYTC